LLLLSPPRAASSIRCVSWCFPFPCSSPGQLAKLISSTGALLQPYACSDSPLIFPDIPFLLPVDCSAAHLVFFSSLYATPFLEIEQPDPSNLSPAFGFYAVLCLSLGCLHRGPPIFSPPSSGMSDDSFFRGSSVLGIFPSHFRAFFFLWSPHSTRTSSLRQLLGSEISPVFLYRPLSFSPPSFEFPHSPCSRWYVGTPVFPFDLNLQSLFRYFFSRPLSWNPFKLVS